MRESRLFKILYHLLGKGHASAPQLAKEFEVSVRTIYRDIDALSSAGIPIYAETGRNGGIYLQDHFVLEKALLSEKEKQDILAALQSLSVIDHMHEQDSLTKLSALFHMQSASWFEVDFSRWGNKTKDNAKFDLLKYAVIHHKTIRITYVNSTGSESQRKINPLKLYYKAKAWYVKAYCEDKQVFRTFKFNRIVEEKLTDHVFEPIAYPDSQDLPSKAYATIKLRFSKRMAYRIYDEFEADDIEVTKDGAFITSANMPEDAWLIGYLLSFGSDVEVIEPTYLRKILCEEAKKIYEFNKP